MKRRNLFVLCWIFLLGLQLVSAPVEIACWPGEVSAFQGEKVVFSFEVKNNLVESIRPEQGYFISYHLYDRAGQLITFDNRRFEIPRVLRRRKTTDFKVPLYFEHRQAGDYIVEFDMVKEGQFWGAAKKWQTSKVSLHLKPLFSRDFKDKYLTTFFKTGVPEFDKEQYLLRMILKNSEIKKDGKLFGFSPGSSYPAVWIRDTATFVYYARLHYPLGVLEGSVELFLQNQGQDGEIVDWVDLSGNTGKNTVETDQESSLVLAAAEVARDNLVWLQKVIKGLRVYDRLEMALDWVWHHKRDAKYGLIYSGFTADWGDVENTYADERARQLSDRSNLVFATYTQARYIQALEKFIEISGNLKKAGRVSKWQARLGNMKVRAKKMLYLQDRGYFIVHVVPGEQQERYFKMERDMLAVGGNAEAMIAGLMNRDQIRGFLEILESKRKKHGLRTVSFTLIPPYPEGFFPHHLLTHPWNYQNGGEWDWIGARVVKGLSMRGFETEAKKYLLEIVKKNLENFNIFEWEDRTGSGRGALFYTGAAGIIGETIVKGYQSSFSK